MSVPTPPSARTAVFHRVLPEDAWRWIDAQTCGTGPEEVGPLQATGRILARPIEAAAALPPGPLAAVDGYALSARETEGAGDYSPLPLALAPPGQALAPGQACAVHCGGPLPDGADAVLSLDGAEVFGETLEVSQAVAPGEHVARPGEEVQRGAPVLPAGRRLRPQDAALLGALGIDRVPVVRAPRVRVVLNAPPQADACGPMLAGLIGRDGGVLETLEAVADPGALREALCRSGADLVLVVGGTGPGANDFAADVLKEAGELAFYGVALHPGDTAAMGRVGPSPAALLPGRPLSCLWSYDVLAGRLLRRLAGRGTGWPYRSVETALTRKVASSLGRLELCRVRLGADGAEPLAVADGRRLATTVAADGFLPVPVQSEGYPEGARVRVYLYDEPD